MDLTLEFYATIHEKQIFERFPDRSLAAPVPRSIVCCFVNRSGSNYLCDLLWSTGAIINFREIFYWEYIAPRVTADMQSLSEYLRAEYERCEKQDKIWGFKASWSQLLMLKDLKIIPNLIQPYFLVMRRKDKIAQAISYFIAASTGKWEKRSDLALEGESSSIIYDANNIYEFLTYILEFEKLIDTALIFMSASRRIVYYEDIVHEPADQVRQICSELGLGYVKPDTTRTIYQVQRTELNQIFRETFLEDLRSAKIKWRT